MALRIDRNVMVTMRDGVHLGTDLYRPADASGPLPALLERTPYGKQDLERMLRAERYAEHGYAVVVQDCRGCHSSEGDLVFLVNEPFDGYDAVEWTARQEWCDGKVGTYGTSYVAWTQSTLATQNPPHLACMIPTMGGWNAYTSSVRQGGAYELRFLAWAFWHSVNHGNAETRALPWLQEGLSSGPDFRHWLRRLPLRRGQSQLSLLPGYERWALELVRHGDYDEFWKQPGFAIEEFLEQHSDVPILLIGGWYDSYTRATLEAFQALRRAKKGPVKVVMGPWVHGTYTTEEQISGDVDLGLEAPLESLDRLHLDWFDQWLKGRETDAARMPAIRWFLMGGGSGHRTRLGNLDHGGCWREGDGWPLPQAEPTAYYLQPDRTLSPRPSDRKESSTSYLYDPRRPVPTIGGNFSSLSYVHPWPEGVRPESVPTPTMIEAVTPAGGFDQTEGPDFFGCTPPYLPLGSRPDVLVFETPPLEQDLEIAGPVEVRLWVSSSARDTDFTAKLIDVYPSSPDYPLGYALNLSDSILRVRYRESRSRARFLEPDEVVSITIVLYPTANRCRKGHRIRLDVSSSNFPRFDVNPNTGEPLGRERSWTIAHNTVFHDRSRPSHVTLPLVAR